MMQKIDEARKALAAFLVPALFVLGSALLADSDGGSTVTTSEWILVVIAALGTSGVVYTVRNGRSPDPTTSTPGPYIPGGLANDPNDSHGV